MSEYTAQYLTSNGKTSLNEVVVDVDVVAYEEILAAYEMTNKFHSIHAVFEMVKDNFYEFESVKFQALQKYILDGNEYCDNYHSLNFRNINRLLTNLLSSVRKYLDYTNRQLSDELQSEFKSFRSVEYDGSVSYRFMEQLRNYSQHREIPVDSITYNQSLVDASDPTGGHECKIEHYLCVGKLKPNSDMKSAVLCEIQKVALDDGYIELTPHVKSYITSIYRIHYALLSFVGTECRQRRKQFVDRAKEILGEELYNSGTFIRFFKGKPKKDYSNKLFAVTNKLECLFPHDSNPLSLAGLNEIRLH